MFLLPSPKGGKKLRKAELLAWVCFEATQLFCCQLCCPIPKASLHHISHEHHTCPLPRPHFFVQFNFCLLPHILHFFFKKEDLFISSLFLYNCRLIVQCAIKSATTSLTEDYLFVAAIDFGTTYSGYAFSSRDDFKKDLLTIRSSQAFNAGSQRHISLKTPTCLLLDDMEELVSFG